MQSSEIREKFIQFFQTKNHAFIPSASVVPENDPTVLFNTAGMQPLVPYLLGEKHPSGKRIVNYQKCVRTGDIDDVGDNSHLTFFEMLGNWSLGDYFKKESIAWSYEFLTDKKWLGIDKRKLAVTVFEGDEDAPRDEFSAQEWRSVGIENVSYLGKKDNWWGPAGQTGPCGPDTEIFYWVGKSEFPTEGSTVGNDEKNWMEIWNNVFMEYVKTADGTFEKAAQQNVDTGMGLERITTVLNGGVSVYETDIFADIIGSIEKVLGITYTSETKNAVRIIADHSRTATIMISDGIVPSNVDQGYILRRLLRRAIRQGHQLGASGVFLTDVIKTVIAKFSPIYANVGLNAVRIIEEIEREEKQFLSTLEKGLKEFAKIANHKLSGKDVFDLFQTYGFPLEMTLELIGERMELSGFDKQSIINEYMVSYEEHQAKSRAGAEQKFKGGLADHSDETTSLHSATHLMLAGLRKYLGPDVHQAGSNITAERLRFDFTYPEKVEKDILEKVEAYVNEAIAQNAKMILEEIPKSQAENDPSIEGSFWEKYPEVVKVYSFKSDDGQIYSRELCGGPHVLATGTMGKFKIQKEEASSRGVRRIKAVLEK